MNKESLKISAVVIVTFAIIFIISQSSIASQHVVPNASNQAQVVNSQNTQSNIYPILHVVDGDTIVVNMNGTNETIRLIGVNTPETVDPKKPVECFGKEASNFLRTMLPSGTQVRLQVDLTQGDKDKYGRLLRYVYFGDVLVDEELIQEGYGFEYTYDKPYEYQIEFKASQAYASAGNLGLWATSTCDGRLIPAK